MVPTTTTVPDSITPPNIAAPGQFSPNGTPPSDATADFYSALNDPKRWVIKSGVPIFKPHERTDPATGKLIQVDTTKLQRIAENIQRMERGGGVPLRMTLGHTEPNKPETQQPPVCGYYRNARVQPFGPKGEPAVVVDEWLDPQYAKVRKNYPYRSSEYYDDTEQITGVALLTRDPFLDLGVVAYERGEPFVAYARESKQATRYSADGKAHQGYRLVVADLADNSDQNSTNYARGDMNGNAKYSAPWPGPAYHPHQIGHSHPSGGAVYSTPQGRGSMFGRGRQNRYADGMPPAAGGDPLQIVYESLSTAVEALQQLVESSAGGPGTPPQQPMPSQGPGGGMPQEPQGPTPNARYARPQRPQQRPQYRYERGEAPTTGQAPVPTPATVSGLPVGYQTKLDALQYQNAQMANALKVLYYERDQSDTEWCVSEIRRLASMGYDVGEFEAQELKKKPREQRHAYLEHIATKYQRIGTEMPPQILGDPTPGPVESNNGPATREEMEAALKMTAGSNDPNAYTNALRYMRQGNPPMGPSFTGNPGYAPPADAGAMVDGNAILNGFAKGFPTG